MGQFLLNGAVLDSFCVMCYLTQGPAQGRCSSSKKECIWEGKGGEKERAGSLVARDVLWLESSADAQGVEPSGQWVLL